MARTNKPAATTVAQAALQDLQKIDKQISLLERQTTFAVQQIAVASILDPVEGEIVIDHSDKHRLKWYSNGAWRSVCDCVAVANGDIVLVGYHGNTASWEDIYKLDPLVPALTRITDVNQAGSTEYYRALWGDAARSKILAIFNQQSGSDRFYQLDPDGTNPTELYVPPVTPWLTTMTFRVTDAGVPYGLYRPSASEATLYIVNLDTDTETSFPASIVSGGTNIRVWALSPDGTRVVSSIQDSGGTKHLVSCDRDGSNVNEYYTTSANIGVQRWKPDGSAVCFYKSGTPHQLHVADPNGSSTTVVVDRGSTPIFNQAWSPDGTKIAYGHNGGTNIAIVNADGTGLVEIPTQGYVFDFDWSPDSNYICIANGDDPCIVELVNVAEETSAVIFDSTTDGQELYLNTVQWASPTFYMS